MPAGSANDIIHDEINLRDFMSHYLEMHERDLDRVSLVSWDGKFGHYSIEKPSLETKLIDNEHWELQPTVAAKVTSVKYQYHTLGLYQKTAFVLRVKTSLYQKLDFHSSDWEMHFYVQNSVELGAVATDKSRSRIVRPLGDGIFSSPMALPIEKKKGQETHWFDIEWYRDVEDWQRYRLNPAYMVLDELARCHSIATGSNKTNYGPDFDDLVESLLGAMVSNLSGLMDTRLARQLLYRELRDLLKIWKDPSLGGSAPSDKQLALVDNLTLLFVADRTNAVNWYFADFFSWLGDCWESMQKISLCEHCYSPNLYRTNKKYCSVKGEGRDCAKKVRNRRDYQKHGPKRRAYYREEMRITRAFERANLRAKGPVPDSY